MAKFKEKELVFGTFMDRGDAAKVKGNTACFVIAVENVDNFIKKQRSSTFKKLAILSRKSVSESFADEFIALINEYKIPNTSNWYRLSPLVEVIQNFNSSSSYKPRAYKTTRTTL